MTLFSSDLYRSFGIGFVAGAIIVAAAAVDQWGSMIESPARAATPVEVTAPDFAPEFAIKPIEVAQ